MHTMHRLMRRRAEGFTLIELLIVVAIIGILAAIAIPNLLSAQRAAKISRSLADAKQIVSQTQLYNNDFNAFPATLSILNTTGYISQTHDPFGADPATQVYGYAAGLAHIWALSVGPAGGGVPPTAQPNASQSGTGCVGEVGWSMIYGSVKPAGC